MLLSLSVQNFAIIEDIKIVFEEGMTSLTGETGAGKSLIIDSINLLLGERADSDLIRYGASRATIEGVFSFDNPSLKKDLDFYAINSEGMITIKRDITNTGKNTVKINNQIVSLTVLKSLAKKIADIHVQHDTLKLVNPENYLDLLDQFGDKTLRKMISDYQLSLIDYKDAYGAYENIIKKNASLNEKIDLVKFQYEELKDANLLVDEDKNLEETINKQINFDKIYGSLKEAVNLLEDNTLDNLYQCANNIEQIKNFDPEFEEKQKALLDYYYEIDDISTTLKNHLSTLDFNPEELNLYQERLNTLKALQKKYRRNNNELIDLIDDLKLELDLFTNSDEVIKDALEKLKSTFDVAYKLADGISNERKKYAKNLEILLVNECKDLDLKAMNFKVDFKNHSDIEYKDYSRFTDIGIDEIDFLVSFNEGEPVKPLLKVASGGELSRLMLSFKKIFASINRLSLMVFDEIDSGISGIAASKMAQKIKDISRVNQVLCITHLPHVASIADHHIHIYKITENNRTKTGIKKLNYNERVKEVALMLSGNENQSALDMAKTLLDNN